MSNITKAKIQLITALSVTACAVIAITLSLLHRNLGIFKSYFSYILTVSLIEIIGSAFSVSYMAYSLYLLDKQKEERKAEIMTRFTIVACGLVLLSVSNKLALILSNSIKEGELFSSKSKALSNLSIYSLIEMIIYSIKIIVEISYFCYKVKSTKYNKKDLLLLTGLILISVAASVFAILNELERAGIINLPANMSLMKSIKVILSCMSLLLVYVTYKIATKIDILVYEERVEQLESKLEDKLNKETWKFNTTRRIENIEETLESNRVTKPNDTELKTEINYLKEKVKYLLGIVSKSKMYYNKTEAEIISENSKLKERALKADMSLAKLEIEIREDIKLKSELIATNKNVRDEYNKLKTQIDLIALKLYLQNKSSEDLQKEIKEIKEISELLHNQIIQQAEDLMLEHKDNLIKFNSMFNFNEKSTNEIACIKLQIEEFKREFYNSCVVTEKRIDDVNTNQNQTRVEVSLSEERFESMRKKMIYFWDFFCIFADIVQQQNSVIHDNILPGLLYGIWKCDFASSQHRAFLNDKGYIAYEINQKTSKKAREWNDQFKQESERIGRALNTESDIKHKVPTAPSTELNEPSSLSAYGNHEPKFSLHI